MDDVKIRAKLPAHAPKPGDSNRAYVLCVDGLVRRPLDSRLADLEKLRQQDLTQGFTCFEGWTVPDVRWRGVLLETVLLLGEPNPDPRYVQASGGEFSISLRRDMAMQALLTIYLGDTPVPPENGGPLRLVVPGVDCFMNIKWLDHLAAAARLGPIPRRQLRQVDWELVPGSREKK